MYVQEKHINFMGNERKHKRHMLPAGIPWSESMEILFGRRRREGGAAANGTTLVLNQGRFRIEPEGVDESSL